MPKLRSIAIRWRKLTGPAPLSDFSDYDDYWQKRGGTERIYRRWTIAVEHIPDGATLLDVGCGNGEFLQYLKSVRPTVIARGIDISASAVERARALGFEADVVNIGESEIDGTYDYVTCFELLEHIAEAETALLRLSRAFTHQLIVSVPNIGSIGCRVRLGVFGRFPITNCVMHIKEHVRHWTPTDFREWVAHHGLCVARSEGQYGVKGTPWRSWPSLFATGMVYVLEHMAAATNATAKSSD
jgi:methionine biosynthesis protein MetW